MIIATENYLRLKPAVDFTEQDFLGFVDYLFQEKRDGVDGLLHAAVGLSGESGEVLDLIKKAWVYGKPIDKVKLAEELGDVIHYFFMMMIKADDELGLGGTLRFYIANNVDKLRKRYPDGFTKEAAIKRADVT